jgi:hypothetical protein
MDPKTSSLRESYDRLARPYAENLFDELSHKPLDRALLHVFAALWRASPPRLSRGG